MPEIGDTLERYESVEFGYSIIKNFEDIKEVFLYRCYASEENSRSESPFEFIARDLNDLADEKPYDVWQVFEDGINKGFLKNFRKRKKYR